MAVDQTRLVLVHQLHTWFYQPCSNEIHQIGTQVVDLVEARSHGLHGNLKQD